MRAAHRRGITGKDIAPLVESDDRIVRLADLNPGDLRRKCFLSMRNNSDPRPHAAEIGLGIERPKQVLIHMEPVCDQLLRRGPANTLQRCHCRHSVGHTKERSVHVVARDRVGLENLTALRVYQ